MRVFCFDLDDTLVSERRYVESGLRAAGRRLDALLGARGSAAWLVRAWRRGGGGDLFQRRLCALGADPADPALVGPLVAAYRRHAPGPLPPRAGVVAVLEALVARGHRLALVSDGHLDAQRAKWRALGLGARLPFAPVIFTDVRGRAGWKPAPWSFEAVMASAPGAEGFVYVGNDAAKDFLAPNRLGWTTVELVHPENLRPSAAAAGPAAPSLRADHPGALLALA